MVTWMLQTLGKKTRYTDFTTTLTTQIFIKKGTAPNDPTSRNPKRTVIQHEEQHITDAIRIYTAYDVAASAYENDWQCPPCTDARIDYVSGVLLDYYIELYGLAAAQLDENDSDGISEDHVKNAIEKKDAANEKLLESLKKVEEICKNK